MMRNPLLKIPVIMLMTTLAIGIALMLFVLTLVGLIAGSLKETFIYISSTQAVAPRTPTFSTNTANVLATQE